MNYKNTNSSQRDFFSSQGLDFPARLRSALERHIKRGEEGIDRADIYEKRREKDVVFRRFSMSDEVFNLGCEIHKSNQSLDPRLWAAWMANSYFRILPNCVVVYQQSAFFADFAQKQLGKIIENHFSKRVFFKVDPEIKFSVEAA